MEPEVVRRAKFNGPVVSLRWGEKVTAPLLCSSFFRDIEERLF